VYYMRLVIVEVKGSFGGEFGASHCNSWGPLLRICAEVREPIELSFGVVSGSGIGVLDGVHVLQEKGQFPGVLAPLVSLGFISIFLHRNIFDLYVKS